MVQPGADAVNQGPWRTAFGYRLLLFFMINMKCPAEETKRMSIFKSVLKILQLHFHFQDQNI